MTEESWGTDPSLAWCFRESTSFLPAPLLEPPACRGRLPKVVAVCMASFSFFSFQAIGRGTGCCCAIDGLFPLDFWMLSCSALLSSHLGACWFSSRKGGILNFHLPSAALCGCFACLALAPGSTRGPRVPGSKWIGPGGFGSGCRNQKVSRSPS